jgi:hypothetical protein
LDYVDIHKRIESSLRVSHPSRIRHPVFLGHFTATRY